MGAVSKLAVAVTLLLCTHLAFSQQLRLGKDPYAVEKSAVLELYSDNQGLLLPRIADTSLINVLNPPDGMIIYFTAAKKLLIRANGYWQTLAINDSVVTSLNGNTGALTMDTGYISNFYLKVRGELSAGSGINYNANTGVISSSINTGNFWNIAGNTGTDSTTNFIGTTDNQDLVFKTNNTETARIVASTGDIKIGSATTGTIRSTDELVLRQDGDTYGSSILRLRNRNTENGAIFETTDATTTLVDFIFKTATSQRNIRYEARASMARAGTPSFHIGGSSPDNPTLAVGDTYAAFNTNLKIGNYNTPTEALDVTGNVRFSGALMPNNTSGSSGNLLSSNGSGAAPSWITMDTGYISNFYLKVRSLSSITAPLTYNSSTGVFGITQATTSTNGYLSSTDWNTFNNKQSAGNFLTDPGGNGIVARTALNTTVNRTITGTTNRITLTNGDGVSGNPTIDISSSYVGQSSITTLGTITTGTWHGTALTSTYLPSTIVYNDQSNTYTAGSKQIFDANNTSADIRLTGNGTDPTTLSAGDVWYNSTSNVFKGRFNTTTRQFATLDGTETFSNKTIDNTNTVTLKDANFTLQDNAATTKQAQFQLSAITAGQTRIVSLPDANTTMVGTDVTQTLTNKTFSGSTNVLGGVTMTLGSDATNDMYYRNSSGVLTRFASANNGILVTNGSGVPSIGATLPSAIGLDTSNISNFYLKVRSLNSTTAPLTYNSSTGVIGITQANTSTNGYLSSTDWNTFNNKQASGNFLTDPGGNGMVVRTALNTTVNRTITGTTNRITLTNGDGVSGNPTIDISSSYVGQSTITTLGTIASGTWNGSILTGTYGGTGINNGAKTITLGNNLTTSGNFALTLTQTGTTNVTLPTTGTLATLAGTENLTNKTLDNTNTITIKDANFTLQDNAATTKQAQFQLSAITAGQTRIVSLPDANTTMVGTDVTQTLTNKTFSGSTNVLGGVTMTLGSDATNDMYYRNSSGVLTRFASANNGILVTNGSGVPSIGATLPSAIGLDTSNISNFYLKVRSLLSGGTGISYNNSTGVITNSGVTSLNGNTGALTMDTGYISNFYTKVRSLSSITAPLTYNSSTGVFGITQANTSTNGYLSSTDWNTFNNKANTASPTFTGIATINSLNLGIQSIATSAGTTTLTSASPYYTVFTGITTQSIVLPNATTLSLGQVYVIENNSTGAVTAKANGGATLWIIAATAELRVILTANGTAAGTWQIDYLGGNYASGKLFTVNNTIIINGTDGTTMTLPTTSKTLAANDGSNWTISGQAIGDIPVASSTTAYGKLADVATGSILISGGVGTAPSWSTSIPSTTTGTTQAIGTNNTTIATTAFVLANSQPLNSAFTALTSGTTITWTPSVITNIYTLTPGASPTINMGAIPAGMVGEYITLIITTSGTTSYTITAGTNLKMQGTLATGTTTAKKFVIQFVVESTTSLLEVGRTIAL